MHFTHKEHPYAIFFDIEKAYDTTWRSRKMMDKLLRENDRGFAGESLNSSTPI